MKRKLLAAAAFLALAACNNEADHAAHRADGFSEKPANAEDSLYKLVMEGHDLAMGKMGKLKGFQDAAQKALDSLKKLPASKGTDSAQQQFKGLQEELNYAIYGMDTWMQEFNPDSAKDNNEKRLKYLQSELDKVNKVQEAIAGGLTKAGKMIK